MYTLLHFTSYLAAIVAFLFVTLSLGMQFPPAFTLDLI
jgi:hypothetical protein